MTGMMMMMNKEGDDGSTSSSSSSSKKGKGKTAGLIIIGDEILKGQVVDTNSHYLSRQLYSYGIKVSRISVIGDIVDEIAEEVRTFSNRFDFVFTTGGIGPTHDDMTYVSVAKAFGDEVAINPDMAGMINKWLGHRNYSEEIVMRMATMPVSAELMFDPKQTTPLSSFPIVIVRNVYIFPGVPRFLQAMFPRLEHILKASGCKFHTGQIYVDRDELSITPQIDQAVEKFKDTVVFGSYPVVDNMYFSTRLTMESTVPGQVEAAGQFLKEVLPENSVIDYDADPLENAAEKVYAIAENPCHALHAPVAKAVQTIEEALRRYGPEKMAICFNGGKDCTALLHLYYAVVQKQCPTKANNLNALCIRIEDPFPEMESFVAETSRRYGLNLWVYNGPIQNGLRCALTEHPELEAVLMGTRRTDPSGHNLGYFEMTDSSWPQVMRVSPLLDWSYQELWQFLRSLSLPYCSLYNQGYTSIGNRSNTFPNPYLVMNDTDGDRKRYRPAYELNIDATERNGRK